MKEESEVIWISRTEAARRLKCAPGTVARAAKRCGVGIVVEGGRLAAVRTLDLPRLKTLIQPTSGNPVWIAAGEQKKKHRRKTP